MCEWNPETLEYEDLDQAEMVDAEGEREVKNGALKKTPKKVNHVFKKASKKRYVFQENDNDGEGG